MRWVNVVAVEGLKVCIPIESAAVRKVCACAVTAIYKYDCALPCSKCGIGISVLVVLVCPRRFPAQEAAEDLRYFLCANLSLYMACLCVTVPGIQSSGV